MRKPEVIGPGASTSSSRKSPSPRVRRFRRHLQRLAASLGGPPRSISRRRELVGAGARTGSVFRAEIAVSKAPLSRREDVRDVPGVMSTERRESEGGHARERGALSACWSITPPRRSWFWTSTPVASWTRTTTRRSSLGSIASGCCRLGPVEPESTAATRRRLLPRSVARAYIQQALRGQHAGVRVVALRLPPAARIVCEVRLVHLPSGNRRLVRGKHRRHLRAQAQRAHGRRRAQGVRAVDAQTPRSPDVLASITRLIESTAAGTVCSVSVPGRGWQGLRLPGSRRSFRKACAGRSSARASTSANGSCCRGRVPGARQVLVGGPSPRTPSGSSGANRHSPRALRAAWSTPIQAAGGKLPRLTRGVSPRAGAADGGGVADHGAPPRSSRASPSSGALAEEALPRERSEVPRSVREYRRGASIRAAATGRPAVGQSGVSSPCSATAAPRSCTRLPSARDAFTGIPPDRTEFTRRVESVGEIRDAEFLMRRARRASSW